MLNNGLSVSGLMGKGLDDFAGGLRRSALWRTLAWNDLRRGNVRTKVGVFWHSISFFIVLVALGFIYAKIFQRTAEVYVPYLAAGFVVWRFISLSMTDGLSILTRNRGFLVQIPIPISTFVFRCVCLHLYIFGLNFLAYIFVVLAFGIVPVPDPLGMIAGLTILAVTAVGMTTLLGIVAVFYSWLQNLLPPLINLMFFVTPIIWMPAMLVGGESSALGSEMTYEPSFRSLILVCNPLYHFVEVLRGPMIGYQPTFTSWAVAGTLAVLSLTGALVALTRTRSQVLVRL